MSGLRMFLFEHVICIHIYELLSSVILYALANFKYVTLLLFTVHSTA